MENNKNNTDDLIRQKFESFAPTPPPHVWPEVEKNIDSSKPLVPFSNKYMAGAAALLLLAALFFLFNPFGSDGDNISNENIITQETEYTEPVIKENVEDETLKEKEEVAVVTQPRKSRKAKKKTVVEAKESDIEDEFEIKEHKSEFGSGYIGSINMKHSDFVLSGKTNYENSMSLLAFEEKSKVEEEKEDDSSEEEISIPKESKQYNGSWKIGVNIWPEITVSNIDSVEVLNSFNINIEPTYFFNKHWFIRSGIGASYVRDRGFARIKYMVKEYMGSYEDVYNVTFDTIGGNVIPTYHTKTVEVWDSVPHVTVASVTNKYLYMHVPLLLGYASDIKNSAFNWYAYAGPVIFFKAGSWIEEPQLNQQDADIIELNNNLPERAGSYFQLWLGAGVEYRVNRNIGLTLEPGYNHYLSNLYSDSNISSPKSGFSLRFGIIFNLK